jgi:hypothetical protein
MPTAASRSVSSAHVGLQQLTIEKELYEPFWEDVVEKLNRQGVAVNSIWMADISNQGASGILNESKLGNDRRSSSILLRLQSTNFATSTLV